ncbi:hypothetical protein ES288_A09G041000v1 [Gossypium darwinii]|uniref:Endonuclease/exonuclease/phosphatase domain-containing protein n=1 Tax=Gossypium darwinii TaxID=34276 RepID=A0A5D2F560_GOSDA|nr:hypothetical protein ES288_A09G041000v1 [Gossypium darwinii]
MKILCWNCRGIGNPTTVRELKQMLVANDPDIVFLCETKINANKFSSVRSRCKMEGCLAVNANGKSGGLVIMWKESNKVEVQTYSSNHIDLIIKLENDNPIWFTEFYGNAEPNKRQCSWNMLRRVGQSVTEKWIIGGDFNAILDNAEKEGGRGKASALMEDFREVVDELSMADLKTDNGWFNWVNNRDGTALVKERLDRFLMSANDMARFPFMETKVIRQSTSDHDAIILDTEGRKSRDRHRDPRLCFKYDVCWAKDVEAKKIIKEAWQKGSADIMGKIEMVGKKLGGWQYKKLKQMCTQMGTLQENINKVIDSQGGTYASNKLKALRIKLGKLLDEEEKYWAQRSRIQWLKEGDRNTRFFHVRAKNRRKKNNIARLKDMDGYWKENTMDISKAIREYFQKLFKSNLNSNTLLNLDYIESCITGEENDRLLKDFTENEIKEAFSQMDPRKAPGIDGLSGNFFKENWEVVGEDIIKLCHDILRGVKNVDCINYTIIVLIPKIKEPVDMTNFRPISLCRVVYKIVAKVLANHLKETLRHALAKIRALLFRGG